MGMYTEFELRTELRQETPNEVLDILEILAADRYLRHSRQFATYEEYLQPYMQHDFFKTDRGAGLFSRGNACFVKAPSFVKRRDVRNSWEDHELFVCCCLKNYDSEIEKFLDWITPWIGSSGFIGYHQYEEDNGPTLLFFRIIASTGYWVHFPVSEPEN